MLQKLLDWLIDTYLSDYIISREDYRYARHQQFAAEQYISVILTELNQSYEDLYNKGIKPYEEYGEGVVAEFGETNRLDLREFQYSYHFRIPHRTYYTLRDPKDYFRETKQVVIAKLTEAFKNHIQKNLFRDL